MYNSVAQSFKSLGLRNPGAGLRSALDYVRDGDVLIVWKLDRLGRSLPDLIETVMSLATRSVGFRSLTEAIDTTTPGGRLVFHLFGALGQFERDLIQERTRAGLAAAAARGRKDGRKPVITDEKLKRAHAIIASGLTVREAAARRARTRCPVRPETAPRSRNYANATEDVAVAASAAGST